MKYFISNDERQGTCCHEFVRGRWDGETYWDAKSIYLHDDVLNDHQAFAKALRQAIKSYDPYGVTLVTAEEWKAVGQAVEALTGDRELYAEADRWVQQALEAKGCFTILGI